MKAELKTKLLQADMKYTPVQCFRAFFFSKHSGPNGTTVFILLVITYGERHRD